MMSKEVTIHSILFNLTVNSNVKKFYLKKLFVKKDCRNVVKPGWLWYDKNINFYDEFCGYRAGAPGFEQNVSHLNRSSSNRAADFEM